MKDGSAQAKLHDIIVIALCIILYLLETYKIVRLHIGKVQFQRTTAHLCII
jgi:hypothetical protein